MEQALRITVNGKERHFETLPEACPLQQVVAALDLKADRIAVEHNGEIAPRAGWPTTPVNSGDRLEVVHFVGGGVPAAAPRSCSSKRSHAVP